MRLLPISLMLAGIALGTVAVAGPRPARSLVPAAGAPEQPAPEAADKSRVIIVSAQEKAKDITLTAGTTTILQLPENAHEVLISNPKVAEASARSARRIFIMAHAIGETNGFIFDRFGHRLLSLNIHVDSGSAELARMLNAALPGARIDVLEHNGEIILTGTVTSAVQAHTAELLAASASGASAGGASAGGTGASSGGSGTTNVINALKVTGAQQVMLKVRIAEMQRAVSKQLGIDLTQSSTNVLGATVLSASTSNPYGIVGAALSDSSQFAVSNGNLSATMKALETVGLAHSLAEPNLVAVSGETAKFLAGGEFPVASGRDSSGNVSVTFKQYGVGLSFTPVVLGPGRISLQLSTEVSELTNTGSLTVTSGTTSTSSSTSSSSDSETSNSTTIPALTVRRAQTTIELPSGGSFAIAGLMQHTTKQQIEGFPGLKDLPILGALFRSRDFENDETELVVLVTAYLVHPVSPHKLRAPTDGFIIPTDPESILLGQINAIYKKDLSHSTDKGQVGFIVK